MPALPCWTPLCLWQELDTSVQYETPCSGRCGQDSLSRHGDALAVPWADALLLGCPASLLGPSPLRPVRVMLNPLEVHWFVQGIAETGE